MLGASVVPDSASALETASAPWRQETVTVGRAAVRLEASSILRAPYASAMKYIYMEICC